MGSTPRLTITGSSTGVTIMMLANISINIPIKIRNIITIIQMIITLPVKSSSAAAITAVMPFSTRTRPKAVAANMMINTRALNQVVELRDSCKPPQVNSL